MLAGWLAGWLAGCSCGLASGAMWTGLDANYVTLVGRLQANDARLLKFDSGQLWWKQFFFRLRSLACQLVAPTPRQAKLAFISSPLAPDGLLNCRGKQKLAQLSLWPGRKAFV